LKGQSILPISYLDGIRYQQAIIAGCNEIIRHEKELNRINVFPIPDKDTGSNLKKTLLPLFSHFPIRQTVINRISHDIADVTVQSALGYSGIIFSQIFLGLAEGFQKYDRIRPENLGPVALSAVQKAYHSIKHPCEGTVLSVLKVWSEEVSRLSPLAKDFAQILVGSHQKALFALKNTPEQLEILKKNRVVDAGGKAWIYFLEGILHFIKKGKLYKFKGRAESSRTIGCQERSVAPCCAECCVKAKKLDRVGLIEKLSGISQELIFYGAAHFAKMHINTHDPEEVFSCVSLFGEISAKKIFKLDNRVSHQEKEPICLIADSTCDISEDLIEDNPVYFVPIKVHAGDKVYTDRWDIIPEEFYDLMDTSQTLPQTSQPSLMDFGRIYRHLLLHYRSIISVHLSKALSGTYQTALQASQQTSPERISVVDGNSISVGLGLVLLEGIRALHRSLHEEETLAKIEKAANRSKIFIGLPTLKFLVKGGRITKTKGFIAEILGLNPILTIDPEGKLISIAKARGKKRLEEKVMELVYEKIGKKTDRISIAVAHTNAFDIGDRIARRIAYTFGREADLVLNASPVLGAHAGPGAFGIAFLEADDHSVPDPGLTLKT
jgi:DegV family protein with EDD domain